MKLPRFSRQAVVWTFVLAAGALAFAFRERLSWTFYSVELPLPERTEQGLIMQDLQGDDFTVLASDLSIPWEIAFLPGGDLLVTERPGTLLRIGKDGSKHEISVDGVKHVGEGGLLGLALHPSFEKNGWVYLYSTVETPKGFRNRVERYTLTGDVLSEKTTILMGIPGAQYHDGGELAFGPDGMLYVTTGDASQSALAQDRDSLAGKILRLKDDGTIPSDNPFGTAIWSYGHRNPQGLVWDGRGRLWATEHGRSGALSGLDELNLIEKGANYGWPTIQGDATEEGMKTPAANSGEWDTWAPAGAAFLDGSVFFGGLRGEALYQAYVESPDGKVTVKTNFEKEFGRIRAVRLGPDRMLYVTTSNTDGRGLVRDGDDKLIRINTRLFRK